MSDIIKKAFDNIDPESEKRLDELLKNEEGVSSDNFSKTDFQKLANDFLMQIEKEDETKPKWQTKNNVPILYNSLHEFYRWLCKNHWK